MRLLLEQLYIESMERKKEAEKEAKLKEMASFNSHQRFLIKYSRNGSIGCVYVNPKMPKYFGVYSSDRELQKKFRQRLSRVGHCSENKKIEYKYPSSSINCFMQALKSLKGIGFEVFEAPDKKKRPPIYMDAAAGFDCVFKDGEPNFIGKWEREGGVLAFEFSRFSIIVHDYFSIICKQEPEKRGEKVYHYWKAYCRIGSRTRSVRIGKDLTQDKIEATYTKFLDMKKDEITQQAAKLPKNPGFDKNKFVCFRWVEGS